MNRWWNHVLDLVQPGSTLQAGPFRPWSPWPTCPPPDVLEARRQCCVRDGRRWVWAFAGWALVMTSLAAALYWVTRI